MHLNFFGERIFRLEAALVFGLLIAVYIRTDASWLLFALLFLTPDLSALGYIAGPKPGAGSYNIGHTIVWPVALAITAMAANSSLMLSIGIIWGAHIAFDRSMGYGIKIPDNPNPGKRRKKQTSHRESSAGRQD